MLGFLELLESNLVIPYVFSIYNIYEADMSQF